MSQITLKDIARDTGLSRSTVSLVMQQSPLVAEPTREKVKKSAEKLGYVYNRAAASLRQQLSGNVGLIVNSVGNPFFAEITVGAEKIFGESGKTVLLGQHSEDTSAQSRLINSMLETRVDGLILVLAYGTTTSMLDRLLSLKVPTILLTRQLENSGITYVGSDNPRGTERIVEHLIEHGCEKFILVGGRVGTPAHTERLAGIYKAVRRNKFAKNSVSVIGEGATRTTGYESAVALASGNLKKVGVIGYNDIVAMGLLAGFRDSRVKVGKDVSVIGIDDIDAAKYETPALTTLHINPQTLGSTAAEELLSIIEEGSVPEQKIILPNTLVIRESCGCKSNRGTK